MSVKGKVKRLNNEIKVLKEQLEVQELSNRRLRNKLDNGNELLENIVKFAITNQVGGLRVGIQIDKYSVDKMRELRLDIDYADFENAYIIRTTY